MSAETNNGGLRAYVTGGTGFVGSNIVKVFAECHGAVVHCPVHSFVPAGATAEPVGLTDPSGGSDDQVHRRPVRPGHGRVTYSAAPVDLTDPAAAAADVARFGPDVIVHAMILNDFDRIRADKAAGWRSYVGVTRTLADAADRAGAKLVLVSTDWVFDGATPGAAEDAPPDPVNYYGFLKAVSEQAALAGAERAAVARVSAVNGVHWTRPAMPRPQDRGFGYFVTTVIEAVEAGETFKVWTDAGGEPVNMTATPSLASECAEMMWRIAADEAAIGIFHCCGSEAIGRVELARLACEVFGLDPDLVTSGPPDPGCMTGAAIPRDTSLRVVRTAEILGYEPLGVRAQLERLRAERAAGALVHQDR